MAEKRSEVMERAADREIVLTRLFDAPPTMVWEAWTDPAQVGLWWGPKGFTTTIEVMDVRVGGVWRLVMHGPDGTDYPNQSTFTEVVPYERLVYRLAGSRRADRPYRSRRLRSLKRRREERGSRCARSLLRLRRATEMCASTVRSRAVNRRWNGWRSTCLYSCQRKHMEEFDEYSNGIFNGHGAT